MCIRLLVLESGGSGVRTAFGPAFRVGAVGGLVVGLFILGVLATTACQLRVLRALHHRAARAASTDAPVRTRLAVKSLGP